MSPSVSWKKQPVIWGRGGAGREEISLGCQACYSGNRTFIVLVGLGGGSSGSGKNQVGVGRVKLGSGVPAITITLPSPPTPFLG